MIIIMGSVGSGKSEQAIRLAKSLNCPRVSTSQLLRDSLTPEWDKKMHAGELIDDREVLKLLDTELKRVGANKNEIVVDGSPRSVTQAKYMLEKVKSGELFITAVVKLNVASDVVLKRLSERGREDDRQEIVLKRLKDFEAVTSPVVNFFRHQGIKVYEVNGELELDVVQAEIRKIIAGKK